VTEATENELQMTFWEHLEELRRRLIKAIMAFGLGAGLSWYFRESILIWLTTPFVEAWGKSVTGKAALHFPAPASLFISYLQLSILAGLVFAMPIIFYQLWAFIAPGLYARERRLAIPFVISSTGLFMGGSYFGWKFAFPIAFKYLLDFSGQLKSGAIELQLEPTVMIGDYIEFISRMLLAFGAVFELPVLVFFLSIAGLIDHTHLIKFSRYFVVIAFVIAAVITPPDIMSQFLLAIPLCALYALSIGIAWIFARRKAQLAKAEADE
jgi:sec-independent protein translocase protein TatC